MSVARNRILIPVLFLLVVAAVVAGLLVGGAGGDEPAELAEDASAPTEQTGAPDQGATDDGTAAGDEAPGDSAAPTAPAPTAPDLTRRLEGDPMAVGPVDAPVGVVVFSDFGCPYCQSWAQETQPTILDYAAEGAVRLEWRDVAILGEDSSRAAVAAAAAAQQDAYYEFHEQLFIDMDARSPEQLTALAAGLGLDVDQFTSDLTDPAVQGLVRGNMEEAQGLGLQSTPSFIIAGTPVVGAQPAEVFVELIEAALAGTG